MQMLWIQILGTAAAMGGFAVLCYWAERRGQLREKGWKWQLMVGMLFGAMAIGAMAFSAEAADTVDNVQDIAPLLAGLLFGAPAGVLAGVVGAVGRVLLLPEIGGHVCYAAAVSLVVSGLFAAFLRRSLFDDKKASVWHGLAAGFLMAVCHIMIFMLMHIHIIGFYQTYTIAENFLLPLAAGNGVGMLLAMLWVSFIGQDYVWERQRKNGLSQIFLRWLLICIVVACSLTCAYTWFIQTEMAVTDVVDDLRLNISDLQDEILELSDKNLLRVTQKVATQITPECYINENGNGPFQNHYLKDLAGAFNVTDINLCDSNGVNVASTTSSFYGYNLADGHQSSEFLILLQGARSFVQRYQPMSSAPEISRKYAGVPLPGGGFIQVGYDAERFHWSLQSSLNGITHHRHIWNSGGIIIADVNGVVVSDSADTPGRNLSSIGVKFPITVNTDTVFQADIHGVPAYCVYNRIEGYYIITYVPREEVFMTRDFSFYIMVVMEVVLFAIIFLMVYFLVKKLVVDNIHKINDSLEKITGGNLNEKVEVHSNEEFTSLSDDINSTVDTLKQYIAEAAARIDKELEFARNIQHSALPSVFPPYPEHKEFEIFAAMDTAKEVGGDFYDFYRLGKHQLAFLIADVSGKGIPAAMFMMTSKTLIKNLAESGLPLTEIFRQANEKLCEGNDTGMFVTAWLGILDWESGKVDFVNAGHNPPVLVQGGQASYLDMPSGLMLGGMEGVPYKAGSFTLSPGDMVLLYTDGLPEALNVNTEMFGKERVLQVMQQRAEEPVERLLPLMKEALDDFVGEADQFDDITMLGMRYFGKKVSSED